MNENPFNLKIFEIPEDRTTEFEFEEEIRIFSELFQSSRVVYETKGIFSKKLRKTTLYSHNLAEYYKKFRSGQKLIFLHETDANMPCFYDFFKPCEAATPDFIEELARVMVHLLDRSETPWDDGALTVVLHDIQGAFRITRRPESAPPAVC